MKLNKTIISLTMSAMLGVFTHSIGLAKERVEQNTNLKIQSNLEKKKEAEISNAEMSKDHKALRESFKNKLDTIARLTLALAEEKWMSDTLNKELMDKIFEVLLPNEVELSALQEELRKKYNLKEQVTTGRPANIEDIVSYLETVARDINEWIHKQGA